MTDLLKHIEDVIKSILNGNEHNALYLDSTKVFDKVDHDILLQKFRHFDIKGKLFAWIKQFLIQHGNRLSLYAESNPLTPEAKIAIHYHPCMEHSPWFGPE